MNNLPSTSSATSSSISRPDVNLVCPNCKKTSTRVDNFKRHINNCKASSPLTANCPKCQATFKRKDNLKRHMKLVSCTGQAANKQRMTQSEQKGEFPCLKCGKVFTFRSNMRRHQARCGGEDLRKRRSKVIRTINPRDASGAVVIQSAFNNNLVTYLIANKYKLIELEIFFTMVFSLIKEKISEHLMRWSSVSYNFAVDALYVNSSNTSIAERNFKTRSEQVYSDSDIEQQLHNGIEKIATEIEEYEGKGSGYTISEIQNVTLNISKLNPLKAACNIPLPQRIARSNSCDHNIYPDTGDCFRRAILAKVPPHKTYDFTNIEFPTSLKSVSEFEKRNNTSIAIFALDEKNKIYPFKKTEEIKDDHIDLLLLSSDNCSHHHFVRIFDFHRLIRSQLTKREAAIVVCRSCFRHYDDRGLPKEEKLRRHMKDCIHKPTRVVMPRYKEMLSFKKHEHKLRIPIVAYADVESLLVPIASCQPDSTNSYTNKLNEHQIMAYCLYVKSDVHSQEQGYFNKALTYTGRDAAHHLIATLIKIASEVMRLYSSVVPVKRNKEIYDAQRLAAHCHFCLLPFTIDDPKVLDHCHLTGCYRGAAHNSCKLKAKQINFLPVLFHNGSGYDFKFLVREIGNFPGDISVIPNTEEKFISFSKRVDDDEGKHHIWLKFLDSYRFLPSSLDAIVKSLDRNQFKVLPKLYQGKQLELLLRKGQMPYEYMTEWDKLEETSLPCKEKFYSSLSESGVSDKEYDHAVDVWRTFNIKTLGEYMELYLMTDTYLLLEVFEAFRREFLSSDYGIDPVYYPTLPSLIFSGMLKVTKVQLELLSDYDMLLFFEKGIRGGFTQATKRHMTADNDTQLLYIDCNNLYGWSSTTPLPQSDFNWIDPKSVDLLSITENSPTGYVAEVDVSFPDNVHDYFNQYPPLTDQAIPPGSKYSKLMATLYPKKRYIVHYRMLQFAVKHNVKLEAVHRVLEFRQSCWLAPFIQLNTEKRKLAKTEFEKDLYKLYNNSAFGKFLESPRRRQDLRLVSEWRKAEKLIARPTFLRRTIINNNLAAIHLRKTNIEFNKPIYAGFTILEMAKWKMLTFHYDVMLKHYGADRLEKLYTDTDSFVYSIRTKEDWRLEAFRQLGDYFDFSNLSEDHPSYSSKNKRVLGLFKDELEGRKLLEWVGLKAKMYAMAIDESPNSPNIIKKAKGIKKSAVKCRLTLQDYKDVLYKDIKLNTRFQTIRSFKHQLFTITVNKLSLTPNDDKRCIQVDKISTLAHGHYRSRDVFDEIEMIFMDQS